MVRKDANSADITEVLNAVSAKLTTDALLELNTAFAADSKPTAAAVASDWLKANGLV